MGIDSFVSKVIHGDALEVLKTIPDNSVDSVITDPPYGISFMSKGWDTFAGNKEYAEWVEQWARECLRVLKPGGHLLAFSGTRTYHALAWGVESAGFEIRDMIEWLYLSGFPKGQDIGKLFDKKTGVEREVIGYDPTSKGIRPGSHNIVGDNWSEHGHKITAPSSELAKQWDGWKTQLKPAHEPIVMARKPLSGTVCTNVEQYGTGAINVDGCRIQMSEEDRDILEKKSSKNPTHNYAESDTRKYGKYAEDKAMPPNELGRFPANCITTDDDEWYSKYFNVTPQEISKKASKRDRNSNVNGDAIDTPNNHVTVKPISLMQWLVRLVTPPQGIVLDPFSGSGTTLVAAAREGLKYIGIEREEASVQIIDKRVLNNTYEVGNVAS